MNVNRHTDDIISVAEQYLAVWDFMCEDNGNKTVQMNALEAVPMKFLPVFSWRDALSETCEIFGDDIHNSS